jgi:hypothetical protein
MDADDGVGGSDDRQSMRKVFMGCIAEDQHRPKNCQRYLQLMPVAKFMVFIVEVADRKD